MARNRANDEAFAEKIRKHVREYGGLGLTKAVNASGQRVEFIETFKNTQLNPAERGLKQRVKDLEAESVAIRFELDNLFNRVAKLEKDLA